MDTIIVIAVLLGVVVLFFLDRKVNGSKSRKTGVKSER
jgi:hypothetical protein